MTKTVYVNPYDPASCDAAIKALKSYKSWALKKTHELCWRLTELGLQTARFYYVPEAGNTDISVEATKNGNNGYLITASGRAVCFLEFGAGVTAGEGYDTSLISPPVDITPDSWSSQHNGEFHQKGYWHYGGTTMDSIVPQMGMYHAVNEMIQQIETVAKEVFA